MVRLTAEPVIVVGDPVLLSHAARNLIENALRYAPGPVEVIVGDDRLTVRDHGLGIPSAQRTVVLQEGIGTGTGTGTGLSIVAWVAELHGAALTLDGAPDGGLLAQITFPRG